MERVTAWESFEPELDKHQFALDASVRYPQELYVVRDENSGEIVAIYVGGIKFAPVLPQAESPMCKGAAT